MNTVKINAARLVKNINNYLIWNGIEGFTDDILDVISAAYSIILEPYLNM